MSFTGVLVGRQGAAYLAIARPWRMNFENAMWTRQLAINSREAAVDSTTIAPPAPPKRSPHSKLLRVCSDRNTNGHFAAIEGECCWRRIDCRSCYCVASFIDPITLLSLTSHHRCTVTSGEHEQTPSRNAKTRLAKVHVGPCQ